MNVLFVNKASREIGSSRIWVYDLCEYLRKVGHRAIINPEPISGDFDTVILGKGCFTPEFAAASKHLNNGASVGWINPSISPTEHSENDW